MDASGAAAMLVLPGEGDLPLPNIAHRTARAVRSARSRFSDDGVVIGNATAPDGSDTVVRLGSDDFDRHVWITGGTGSGKSTLLATMARSEAADGGGFMVLDPHGPLVDEILAVLPKKRHRDVILIDAGNSTAVTPINPLTVSTELEREVVIQDLGELFYDLFDPHHTGIVGPRFEAWLRIGVRTLLADGEGSPSSILDIPRLFLDDQFLNHRLKSVTDPVVREFWSAEMGRTSDFHRSEMIGWFSSKFEGFRTNRLLRRILGTGLDVVPLDRAMDERKIVLIKLEKAKIGTVNARLLGYLWLNKLWTSALRRQNQSRFTAYVDEAQTFSASALPTLASEGRKWGVRLVIAHQFARQLRPELAGALTGNAATTIAFRMGHDDADSFGVRFGPEFGALALRYLENYRAACQMLHEGQLDRPFTLRCRPPYPRIAGQEVSVSKLSLQKWSVPSNEVDDLLARGFAV